MYSSPQNSSERMVHEQCVQGPPAAPSRRQRIGLEALPASSHRECVGPDFSTETTSPKNYSAEFKTDEMSSQMESRDVYDSLNARAVESARGQSTPMSPDDFESDLDFALDELQTNSAEETTSSESIRELGEERTEEVEDEDYSEETCEDRQRREAEESEALARQLMAEEAMGAYAISTDFLRDNSANYSAEDLAALEAAMAEEDPDVMLEEGEDTDQEPSMELSYDALLRLGERLGDVKQERWEMVSKERIKQLPTFEYKPVDATKTTTLDDSEMKCLVCQCEYEEGETLRRLPCGHCFHSDCCDQWLQSKEVCPYCKQSIIKNESEWKAIIDGGGSRW
mmetsp:Transcript_21816/g.39415  ORF Transcript_21816/g.39415 Transcript_21816/m.39415 type:complete len:340 (-) Transcript_21816:64-1083(-)